MTRAELAVLVLMLVALVLILYTLPSVWRECRAAGHSMPYCLRMVLR